MNFQFMKKYIANIITGSRIIFSLPLVFIPLSSAWFYIFYLFCGLTDMIDGAIARRTGAVSKFGAKLDTVADFVFMFVCSMKILPLMHMPVWLWVWTIIVTLIKIFNIALTVRNSRLGRGYKVHSSNSLASPKNTHSPETAIVSGGSFRTVSGNKESAC